MQADAECSGRRRAKGDVVPDIAPERDVLGITGLSCQRQHRGDSRGGRNTDSDEIRENGGGDRAGPTAAQRP